MTQSQSVIPSVPPVATLGVPRIGRHRELKFALESYWSGSSNAAVLLETAKALRAAHWKEQRARGVSKIPSNDFSLYDPMLDTAVMVGAVPERYGWKGGTMPLDIYFAMARGRQGEGDATSCTPSSCAQGVSALGMTKWFDTNYHYIVPELSREQVFSLSSTKPIDHFLEAQAIGIHTRPVLLGPVTFLKLSKPQDETFDVFSLLPRLIPVYEEVLRKLRQAGADWVQIDEPALVLDLSAQEQEAFTRGYRQLAEAVPELKIMLASYFGGLGDNHETVLSLPVAGVHLDLVRAPEQLEKCGDFIARACVLSLGIIDGRNVWRANLPSLVEQIESLRRQWPHASIELAPSCSLLHVPIDLAMESELDAEVKPWLAFAVQKMDELALLARALSEGRNAVSAELQISGEVAAARAASPKVHNSLVRERLARIDAAALEQRRSPFAERRQMQDRVLTLPLFPTTTIGSFPQTEAVRKMRAEQARGALDRTAYEAFLKKETEAAIRWQEEIGLDVLVHGEFERNDMVQYFGEQLSGFVFTKHAWVQSYGARFVRPPILYGDVTRPHPMTVSWWQFAQSLTNKPVKGMLTGPVTILNWSFVRDDLPRSSVCQQIAWVLREEVADLEKAGARIIQIDEAALREGLPLRKTAWKSYLDWAVACFRFASSGVRDTTQIHTHMCYSAFNDIIDAIAKMDADVISIETARSRMELLNAFESYNYPNEIGPGVYDIHSPRVPETQEIVALLRLALKYLKVRQLWVNPDCGLKTRKWEEVRPALVNMVKAAHSLRETQFSAQETLSIGKTQ